MRLALLLAAFIIPPQDDLRELKQRLAHKESDVRAKAARALAKMNRLEATALLPDLLLDPSAYVRDTCFMALADISDDASTEFIISQGLGRPEEKVRRDVCEWARQEKVIRAVPALKRLLRDRAPGVREEAALALGEIGDASAVPALRKALRERRGDVRAQILFALGLLAGDGAAEEVRKGSEDRSWEVRVVSVGLASRCLSREDAIDVATKALGDRTWPVRSAAIELLADLKDPSGVEPLIDLLEEGGRLGHEAHGALIRLTGKDIPPDPVLWREWWGVNRESFRPPTDETRKDDPRKKTRTRLRYHGVPILSHRIAFVLDLSGSMRDSAADGSPKFDLAREELLRVIDQLPYDAYFNIYFYNEEVTSWRKEAAPAAPKSKEAARAFIERQKPKGYTNLYGGLRSALDDLQVDTIYLLSDGGPSRGEVIFTERILRRIADRNRLRRVVLHSIDTGSRRWHQTSLLKGLAGSSGGEYLRLGGE